MGDNATEIDLDSVIDRLLEGAFPPLIASQDRTKECLGLLIEHIFRTNGGIMPVWAWPYLS
jgi:hypothetical protein